MLSMGLFHVKNKLDSGRPYSRGSNGGEFQSYRWFFRRILTCKTSASAIEGLSVVRELLWVILLKNVSYVSRSIPGLPAIPARYKSRL